MAVFAALALAWLALDRATKAAFDAYRPGELIAGPFANVFQLRLVHNTGAAWGMFGDSTFALGVLSSAVCLAVLAGAVALRRRMPGVAAVGAALVFAGGLGNAIDRFAFGYVVDFIEPVFIDFPVFNVADIGVTCGIVLLFIGYLLYERREVARERAVPPRSADRAAADEERSR